MQVAPKTRAFLDRLKQETQDAPPPLPINKDNLGELRRTTKELFREYAGPLPDGVSESSFKDYAFELPDGNSVSAKIYTPVSFNPSVDSTVIFFQGNGFLFDMLESHLPGLARMANAANCQIIGVDTPLAPEHTPEEINDLSYAVVRYVFQNSGELNTNSENIVLAGYSAGGNIVANIVNKARTDSVLKVKQQLLLSPALDLSLQTRRDSPYAEYQKKDETATIEGVRQIVELYYNDVDPKNPLISPLFEEDLTAVPPTTIVLAEFDAARGDGQEYARRLQEAGVSVKIAICEGQTHNFFIARGVMDDPPDPAIVMAQAILESNDSVRQDR